jgi:hypothetical protein
LAPAEIRPSQVRRGIRLTIAWPAEISASPYQIGRPAGDASGTPAASKTPDASRFAAGAEAVITSERWTDAPRYWTNSGAR